MIVLSGPGDVGVAVSADLAQPQERTARTSTRLNRQLQQCRPIFYLRVPVWLQVQD